MMKKLLNFHYDSRHHRLPSLSPLPSLLSSLPHHLLSSFLPFYFILSSLPSILCLLLYVPPNHQRQPTCLPIRHFLPLPLSLSFLPPAPSLPILPSASPFPPWQPGIISPPNKASNSRVLASVCHNKVGGKRRRKGGSEGGKKKVSAFYL